MQILTHWVQDGAQDCILLSSQVMLMLSIFEPYLTLNRKFDSFIFPTDNMHFCCLHGALMHCLLIEACLEARALPL